MRSQQPTARARIHKRTLLKLCLRKAPKLELKSSFPARKAPVNQQRITTDVRTEYAVPTVNSKGKNPQVDTAQALSEECSESRKPKTFVPKNSRAMSTTFPARNIVRNPAGKTTERAAKRWKTGAMLKWSLSAYFGVTLLGAVRAPLQNLQGDGQPARAGGRCLVTMPSRPGPLGPCRVRPSRTCGRSGANSYPSQYPTPAGLLASAGRPDWHGGDGS